MQCNRAVLESQCGKAERQNCVSALPVAAQQIWRSAPPHRPPTVAEAPKSNARGYHGSIRAGCDTSATAPLPRCRRTRSRGRFRDRPRKSTQLADRLAAGCEFRTGLLKVREYRVLSIQVPREHYQRHEVAQPVYRPPEHRVRDDSEDNWHCCHCEESMPTDRVSRPDLGSGCPRDHPRCREPQCPNRIRRWIELVRTKVRSQVNALLGE